MLDKLALKNKLFAAVDESLADVKAYADDIATHAELGFFEHRTSDKLAQQLQKLGLNVERGLAITGMKANIGSRQGPKIALIGELDGIPCKTHPQADPVTGASHSCGHNLQTSIILAAASALVKTGAMNELDGSVALMGVPAEEFIEIDRRKKMRDEGKIHYLCGKPEMILAGAFDDVDMSMMVHAGEFAEHAGFRIPWHSNGFRAFMIRYEGKQAHAAAAPDQGINALYAAVAGINAVNALRETFRDNDHVRVHYIITKGGDTVNCVPDDVRLEGYVRASSAEVMDEVFAKVERAFKAGADSLGCKFHFTSIAGDMPVVPSQELNDLFYTNASALVGAENIIRGTYMAGSTDMGDICHIMPAIHPNAGGCVGTAHGATFRVTDFDAAVAAPAKVLLGMVVDLLADGAESAKGILSRFKPVYTKQEYLASMDSRFSEY